MRFLTSDTNDTNKGNYAHLKPCPVRPLLRYTYFGFTAFKNRTKNNLTSTRVIF